MDIMIVDGNAEDAELLEQLVTQLDSKASFKITHNSLEDSLVRIRQGSEPDIIILSMKKNGYQALHTLRQYAVKSHVFIHTGKAVMVPASLMLSTQTAKQRFMVKQSSRILTIPIEQVAYFFADNRINFLRTWDNKVHVVDYTMEELNSMLNPLDFFRISRSHIISYKSIQEIRPYFNSRIKLLIGSSKEKAEEFVSKERVSDFKKWIGAK
jgi:DNA-binding LytR/AlgR family response regulator